MSMNTTTEAKPQANRIFISYKRTDKEVVFKIKDKVENATGEKCWIDLDGIESDAMFKSVIIKAINECEVFLFMYSQKHSEITDFDNDWTIKELNFASKKKKRVVFVNIDGSELSDIFLFDYDITQQIDGRSSESVERLCSDLKKWLNITNTTSSRDQQTHQPSPSYRESIPEEKDLTFNVKGVSFKMVKVDGGTFTMGATAEQGKDAHDKERPVHQVTLTDYYIGQTQVTQALWKAVMGDNPSYYKGDNLPVEKVSWYDCQTFIKKLNGLLSDQLGGMRFALPTEAQWEFAARGGNKSKGYKYAGSNNIDDVAWYDLAWWGNSGDMTTHPVAQKRPNELGLYDMSGNVYEWCQDWYNDYSSNAQTNPQGPTDGKKRVCRGGSWYICDDYCRVSNRSYSTPDYPDNYNYIVYGGLNGRDSTLGLRLCLIP